ncbi:DNA damage-inducible protein 1 [Entomophthora muscae]|uniref:DNA damage-inducible protein 1 n=1 Tax=Entomophthora muscae TaxID=34485 RepID=A0ACC2STB9_9FUNG|nr:DNA damage-inducible protein 1 [Entomophthora muscae]
MVACLQQKDLINVNDARGSLCHSLLSQFPKLWAEFSGQVNGLNNLSEIVYQVYTLPNLQAQLAKYRTEGFSLCKVFCTTPEGSSMKKPYHERLGYDGCFACQEKGYFLKDCPYVKVLQQMQNMEGDGCRESPSPEPEPPPTKVTGSDGIFAILSSPVPGTKGPPKRSERLQARSALAQAISTTIKNPTAKPYLLQSVESDNTDPQDDPDSSSIILNVSISLPLQTILKVVLGLKSALSLLREALNPQGVHVTLPMELCNPILCLCTWIEVTVFDKSIRAVLDTGTPTNIISSCLARRLGFLPDISYTESFFTAGIESIKSNGAYSSVPLRSGELVMTYPSVVLESESYVMLICTDLLRTYQTKISHLHGHFSILGYTVPLFFKDPSDVFLVSKKRQVDGMFASGTHMVSWACLKNWQTPLSSPYQHMAITKRISSCGQISLSGFLQRLKLL